MAGLQVRRAPEVIYPKAATLEAVQDLPFPGGSQEGAETVGPVLGRQG